MPLGEWTANILALSILEENASSMIFLDPLSAVLKWKMMNIVAKYVETYSRIGQNATNFPLNYIKSIAHGGWWEIDYLSRQDSDASNR